MAESTKTTELGKQILNLLGDDEPQNMTTLCFASAYLIYRNGRPESDEAAIALYTKTVGTFLTLLRETGLPPGWTQ